MRLLASSASAKANIPIRIWPSICLTSSLREKRPSRCASIWCRAFCAECKPTPIGSLKSPTKPASRFTGSSFSRYPRSRGGLGGCVDKRQPSILQRFRNSVEPLVDRRDLALQRLNLRPHCRIHDADRRSELHDREFAAVAQRREQGELETMSIAFDAC